ncbi:MAG: nitrogen fixation protein NifH [Acidimicrobiales bacterium]|jgi:hypothetical protein
MTWTDHLTGDPLPWLLADDAPAVRAATLQRLCDLPHDDAEVVTARAAATRTEPIRSILNAQAAEGWWVKPGAGYAPKYTGTVWELIFLDQLGADPADPRIRRACDYVLCHTRATSGGFGSSGANDDAPPPQSRVIHCLNGNLIRALIGFGCWGDPRLSASVDWAARAITGDDADRYYQSGTSGPAFACAANDHNPCAWGAVKELLGLARVPPDERSRIVRRAIDQGVEFLLSRDPAVADYPMPSRDTKPSGSWYKLGFPSGYVTDVLQNLEVLAELGHARNPNLASALRWVESQQDQGRWTNRYAYNGKTIVDIERQGQSSKWVTLRACSVLKAAWQ